MLITAEGDIINADQVESIRFVDGFFHEAMVATGNGAQFTLVHVERHHWNAFVDFMTRHRNDDVIDFRVGSPARNVIDQLSKETQTND